ncbi:hypothetical protein LHJ74_03355 [Streptomyces sp. N2-109]|uniref:Uncharacterized protein n=1 Tax=Streptomyces gossypii TaxID=2883101 RepID=A0ABT2JM71_9ACTN|nr:hypothetical protein [Streptomyces gossypii]MCT2588981.1 hypothetical protein [Streptomyces gossypii]
MSEPMPGGEPEEHGDTGTVAGPDARTEAGTDASTEAGTDASTEAGTDASTEAGTGAGTEAGPSPLGLGIEPTGHEPVDAQLRRLEDADHLAVSGHLEVYEDVHRGLRDTLTALDQPAAPAVPAVPVVSEVRS